MIIEYTVNLKNKTKDELIMYIKEQSEYIKNLENQVEQFADVYINQLENNLKLENKLKEVTDINVGE